MPGLSADPLHAPKAPLRLRVREAAQALTPNVTIAELARRTGLTRGLVERYWKNQTTAVSLDALARIAEALDVPWQTLLTTEAEAADRPKPPGPGDTPLPAPSDGLPPGPVLHTEMD